MVIRKITFTISLIWYSALVHAQADDKNVLLRIYEDNDFINLKKRTDRWYTQGLNIGFFYAKSDTTKSVFDLVDIRAGKNSMIVRGWSVSQLIVTPSDISLAHPDPGDYPYAGTLYISNTTISSNPSLRYSILTDLSLGIIGPGAMAGKVQTFVHKRINNVIPQGWSTQWRNDVLINYAVSIEKEQWHTRMTDLIVGSRFSVGTLLTQASLYSVIRLGRMNDYFKGMFSQFASNGRDDKKFQAYFTIIPSMDLVLRDALLQGGLFRDKDSYAENPKKTPRLLEHHFVNLSYGMVVSFQKFSFSFSQRWLAPRVENMPRHQVGNITLNVLL